MDRVDRHEGLERLSRDVLGLQTSQALIELNTLRRFFHGYDK